MARDLCDEESGRGRPVAFRSHGSGIAPVRRSNRLVRAIEMDIVPRLVQAHRARQIPDVSDPARAGGGLGDGQVREFTRLLIAADSAGAFRRIEQLRADGATPEGLLLDLFAPAARRLGCLWEEDLCDFTEVTVGLWRLELASRELSREALCAVVPGTAAGRVLLGSMPGEQHTLGLTILSEFFRRAGWDVAGVVSRSRRDLAHASRSEWYAVVGLSVSTTGQLDGLPAVIASIRRASRNRAIAVMVGGSVFIDRPQLVAEVGADLTAGDAREAVRQARKLLDHAMKRSSNPRLA